MQLSKNVFILQIDEGRFQREKIVYYWKKNGVCLLIFMKILYIIFIKIYFKTL